MPRFAAVLATGTSVLRPRTPRPRATIAMLNYALLFLLIALVAGILGFGVIAGTAATMARVLFLLFLVLFAFSLLRGAKAK